jgi:hypothetical protein
VSPPGKRRERFFHRLLNDYENSTGIGNNCPVAPTTILLYDQSEVHVAYSPPQSGLSSVSNKYTALGAEEI